MFQTPDDHVFDCIKHLVPGGMEHLSRLLPGQSSRPACQEQHIGFGQTAFAVTPRNLFDDDRFAPATIDAPHGIHEKNQKAPERNELEATLAELIVSGSGPAAARTNRPGTLAQKYVDFHALVIGAEASFLIHEPRKTVTSI